MQQRFSISILSGISLIESSLYDQKQCSCFNFDNNSCFITSTDIGYCLLGKTKIFVLFASTNKSNPPLIFKCSNSRIQYLPKSHFAQRTKFQACRFHAHCLECSYNSRKRYTFPTFYFRDLCPFNPHKLT